MAKEKNTGESNDGVLTIIMMILIGKTNSHKNFNCNNDDNKIILLVLFR